MKSPETIILRELIEHENAYVSGSTLAEKIGMSRVAVWQYMEKLREQGFAFKATRARGYQLAQKPTNLNATLVRAYLPLRDRGLTLTVLDDVDSTNDEAARLLSTENPVPFVVLARQQNSGRGRFGRKWLSEPNGNLYASFAFRPQLEPTRMQTFTLWMGANICELIANFCRVAPGLKWPNDLLFDGRKAGGMLTEARIDADHIRDLVFGLGLNLRTPSGGWPAELASRATALDAHAPAPVDVNKFTAALIGRVLLAYERFVDGDYAGTLAEMWNRHDVLRGQTVTAIQGNRRISGTAAGIDDEGSLIVRTDKGKTERLRAGEVSMEKQSS